MANIEKVIKGLECCRIDENRHINCADCPYYTDDDKGQMWCSNEINNDAIKLLKEKIPKSPTWRRGKAFCGGCGGCLENKEQHSSDIVSSIRFCKWCGTPVDWSNE